MRREKFIYNKHTLQFERFKLSYKTILYRVLGFLSAVIVSGFLLTSLVWKFFPSPQEENLMKEISFLQGELNSLHKDYEKMSLVLTNIHERDINVHRMVLEMDPIDNAVWEGGVGGHERYSEFRNYRNAGELLKSVRQKADKLKRQMVLQSKSLDDIEKMAIDKEKMRASIPSIKPVRVDRLNNKLELLSGFGFRLHPIYKIRRMHAGIDFSAPKGTAIQATGDGVVEEVVYARGGFGLHVVINHGYGYKTLYGHMMKATVKVGQKIKKGQVIGKVGSSGTSTAPHCHYEVHYKGQPVNPINFVMDGLTPKEYQELVRLAEIENQSFD